MGRGWLWLGFFFFFSSRRRHTRYIGDWSSDVCSSDLHRLAARQVVLAEHLPEAAGRPWAARQRATIVDHEAVDAPVRLASHGILADDEVRSEERRVGKECRSWWEPGA